MRAVGWEPCDFILQVLLIVALRVIKLLTKTKGIIQYFLQVVYRIKKVEVNSSFQFTSLLIFHIFVKYL